MKKKSNKTILKRIHKGKNCCPVCGSYHSHSTGNQAEYPEMWEDEYCSNCGQKVGTIDNSPYVHICDEIREENLRSYRKIQSWIKENVWIWNRPF